MFPFHGSCELSFQLPNDVETTTTTTTTTTSTTNHNNNNYCRRKVEQDVSASNSSAPLPLPLHLHLPPPHRYSNHHHSQAPANNSLGIGIQNTRKGRPRKSQTTTKQATHLHNNEHQDEICGNDTAKRRTIHRDIERQRRQEMSNLYSSLRSLLPLEYIKGKRSMCDHITEAARYIKDLEKNVKELGDNRDKLKGSSSNSTTSTPRSRSSIDCNVSIHKLSRGIEIEISVGLGDGQEDAFPLSRVVEVLIEEGFDVVSCVSSRVNQRWIHVIHCEVNDVNSVDLQHLQRKLMGRIVHIDP